MCVCVFFVCFAWKHVLCWQPPQSDSVSDGSFCVRRHYIAFDCTNWTAVWSLRIDSLNLIYLFICFTLHSYQRERKSMQRRHNAIGGTHNKWKNEFKFKSRPNWTKLTLKSDAVPFNVIKATLFECKLIHRRSGVYLGNSVSSNVQYKWARLTNWRCNNSMNIFIALQTYLKRLLHFNSSNIVQSNRQRDRQNPVQRWSITNRFRLTYPHHEHHIEY